MTTPLQMASLICIDWSGFASDDRAPVHEANSRMMESRGRARFTLEEWQLNTKQNAHEFLKELGLLTLHEITNPKLIDEEYRRIFNEVRTEGFMPTMYPAAPAFLECLVGKGKTIHVISSHPEPNLRAEAESYGLDRFITSFTGDVADKAQAMRVIKGRSDALSAYMGDTVSDVRYAKTAGFISVAVADGYHSYERLKAEEPDMLFRTLADLHEHFA